MTDGILPNLMKAVNPLIQEVKQIPVEIKKTFLENPIIQLLKSSDKYTNKKTVLKAVKKFVTLYRGKNDKLSLLFV